MFTYTAIISIIIAGLICLVVTASGVIHDSEPDGILAGEVQEPNYVEGELLVRFAKKPDGTILTRHERNTILAYFDVQEKGAYTLVPGLTIVKMPKGMKVEEAIVSLEKKPEILYAEPDYILKALFTPNDPKFDKQWGLHNEEQTGGTYNADINAPEAWDLSMGTREIVVAVIDSGVDYYHSDLAGNMWVNIGEIPGNGIDDDENGYVDDVYGYNFIGIDPNGDPNGLPVVDPNHNGDPRDDMGHGTHCAGIVGAVTNNNTGVAGVCPNVRIMTLKFLNKAGFGDTKNAISCIQYAVYMGANIMSNSWGQRTNKPSNALKEAIEAADDAGLLFIAAAGNDNINNDTDPKPAYPSSYDCDNIIAVLSTDHNDKRSDHGTWASNYGLNSVDLGAPGSSIMSCLLFDEYASKSGTSMACPHVAGACALVWSINPSLSYSEVKDIIMASVDELDSLDGLCVTEGRLNLYKAILEIPQSKGFVTLDRNYYNCDCNVGIFLADYDLKGANNVNVTIACANDLETVTLDETEPNTGVFTGTISTGPGEPNSGDGVLQVAHDEIIAATYEDANDGTGNPASPNDTAIADCVCPVIYDVNFDENPIGPDDITVTFDTNEFSYTHVLYGESCGSPNKTSTFSLGYGHTVKLKEVSPWTDYYFIIEATDLAGNKTTDSNDGNCYRFTTDGPRDINVPGDFNTIQEAIDQPIWDGSTIWVSEGTYYEMVDFKGKGITVTSTDPNDWDVVEATIIIDANGAYHTVKFFSGEDSNSVFKGFTVKNDVYIGIQCHYSSSPIISNCIIKESPIGVALNSFNNPASPLIINNIIRENTTYGIYYDTLLKPIIKNNLIYNNGYYGIYADSTSSPVVICNNTIVGHEYGIYVTGTSPTITNCILWDNTDNLVDCNATYSCIEDPNDANGVGNITDEPLFVDDANDNYHLDTNSPCFNAGDPNGDYSGETDIDGDGRVLNGRVDMGTDEMTCLSRNDTYYNNWIYWSKPECWCYQRQCRGDVDGEKEGAYWVSDNDMDKFEECFNKIEDNLPDGCECADFDHQKAGPFWVAVPDLNIIRAYFEESEPNVPTCGDCVKVNFWTN